MTIIYDEIPRDLRRSLASAISDFGPLNDDEDHGPVIQRLHDVTGRILAAHHHDPAEPTLDDLRRAVLDASATQYIYPSTDNHVATINAARALVDALRAAEGTQP